MTATLFSAVAARALAESLEDVGPTASPHDIKAVFAINLAQLLGEPRPSADAFHVRMAKPRMTPADVRSIVYAVLDNALPAQTVVGLMNALDNAMALATHPAAREGR